MTTKCPRQKCPVCERPIAVRWGRFERHDPPDRGGIHRYLVSCTGSLRQAPGDGWEQPLLYDHGRLALFDMAD